MLLVVTAAVWLAIALATWRDAHRELDALLDAHLAQSASLLIAQSAHELEELDLDDLRELAPYGQHVAFQVWNEGRDLVLKSVDAPTSRFSTIDRGFSDATIGRTDWRVYSGWDRKRRALVQVAERRAPRERLATRIAMSTVMPLIFGLPLLGLAVAWIVARALRPVQSLMREVERRSPQALDPIILPDVPREVMPLVARMNQLFARVRQTLQQERQFAANAAHELRNPLAALRVQAEVARDAADETIARAALDQVIEACDRLTRLISQLLLLARVGEAGAPREPCSLDALAREVVAAVAPAALEAGHELALEAAAPVVVQGNATLLEALLRNLLDNAMRHGGSGLHILVSVAVCGSLAQLEVIDDGVGIDAAELEGLGTPFHRPPGTAAAGSGLGLALVRRIAEWHGGSVIFVPGDAGRGLRATVALPLSPA
ncbi:MAG: sensor histidine kinase N-terminal domain-containing protein [Pseudomonadales bacterium]|nr:sensor histidine kinase N-terminal domain-containing protein [Pseudomonadales bacterium]